MSEFTKPVEDLAREVREYVDLKADDLKLRAVKGLSVSLGRLLAMILVLFAASVVMLALAFGLILWLGDAIGSYAGGAFIVAGVFVVVAAVLFALRKKLFVGGFVGLFAKMFFEEDGEDAE